MEIITHSHIDAAHAAGPYFSQAKSADGRFSWHHGAPGYIGIRCEGTVLTDNTAGKVGLHQVYLQHGENDLEVSAELLAEARDFSTALDAVQEERRRAEWDAEMAALEQAPKLTPEQAVLVARYQTSAAAWDAEDERAWAVLREAGY